jgi:hypothetical protein
MKYSTIVTGKTPYKTKVTKAPSMVPLELVASAAAIMTATYNQAIGTIYMLVLNRGMSGYRRPIPEILSS